MNNDRDHRDDSQLGFAAAIPAVLAIYITLAALATAVGAYA